MEALGLGTATLGFYRNYDGGRKQIAYQIVVMRGSKPVWDSGKVESPAMTHIYPKGDHGFFGGKAAQAGGNPGVVNRDAQDWFRDGIRFLLYVFGDFEIFGQNTAGDLPDQSVVPLDTPLRYPVKRQKCMEAIQSADSQLIPRIEGNIMAHGRSFDQLAVYSPDIFTPELPEKLSDVLIGCNNDKE